VEQGELAQVLRLAVNQARESLHASTHRRTAGREDHSTDEIGGDR
jgi:hypothetical protein